LPVLVRQAVPFLTSRQGYANPPLTIYWGINSVCNLACKMCDVGMANKNSNFFKNLRLDGSRQEIPLEKFKSVIDEVAPFKPMISITSTEPLLYKDLCEAIAYTRAKGLEIAVTTNGYLLPGLAEDLVRAGLSRLNVSIDGPAEVHNLIRGRRDSFQRTTEGVVLFKEAARRQGLTPEVLCAFTITNLNYRNLVDFVEAVARLPFDNIIFGHMTYVSPEMVQSHNDIWGNQFPAAASCINEVATPFLVDTKILHQQIQEVIGRQDARLRFLPEMNARQLETYYHNPGQFLSRARCMVSWFIAEIIGSGEVIPYTRCFNLSFGNVHEQKFMDIWNGEKMRAWRRQLRRVRRFPACSRCDQAT
jgi:MoaA/NifB/PqqE/SkfB family radical SAM enzyme